MRARWIVGMGWLFACSGEMPGAVDSGAADSGIDATMKLDGAPDASLDSSGNPETSNDASGDADATSLDAGIEGGTDLAIEVDEWDTTMAMPAVLPGVAVRVESSQGFVEGVTDSMGVAHLSVDPMKGPFDVTAAMKDYVAVSVIGVTGPLGSAIIIGKSVPFSFSTYTAAGTISGKLDNGHQVQVDGPWFQTVVTTSGSYSTSFSAANMGNSPPLPLTAIEIDGQGVVVNAVQTSSIARPTSNTTIDITLPGSASFMSSTATVNWPSAGILKGSDITSVQSQPLGNVIVAKDYATPFGEMYVGTGTTAPPTNNVSSVHLQFGSGGFAPDVWEATYFAGMSRVADIRSSAFNNGVVNVGQVNKLDLTGTTLDNASYDDDTMGYDAFHVVFFTNAAARWVIWSAGSKLNAHGVPNLPSAVKLADIGGAPFDSFIESVAFEGGSTAPWSETTKRVNVRVSQPGGMFGAGMRP